jgi:hypothetical protein
MTKARLGMVIDPTALAIWQQLATDTDSYPRSGPGAKLDNRKAAVSRVMERVAANEALVRVIREALKGASDDDR